MTKIKLVIVVFMLACFFIFAINFKKLQKENFRVEQYVESNYENWKSAIKNRTGCEHNFAEYKFKKSDQYYVLYNYVISKKRFNCEESVTYVTNGDYSYLKNLKTTVERWQGPISVALHAPGSDFRVTVDSIMYMRRCIPGIEKFVTFHLYFNKKFSPKKIPLPSRILSTKMNCSSKPPYEAASNKNKFVTKNKIPYPINVGRNIARSMAETHFVLVCDIELHPSLSIIPQFLTLVAASKGSFDQTGRTVYVLPVFEIERNSSLPRRKSELRELIGRGAAVPFHNNTCSRCHAIPNYDAWVRDDDYEKLSVFTSAKRQGAYHLWEPFYIGTKREPPFDERLSWEGKSDKIVQAFTMCLMDYTFSVLNNAFLVHNPGIKQKDSLQHKETIQKTNQFIAKTVVPQLIKRYGNEPNCEY